MDEIDELVDAAQARLTAFGLECSVRREGSPLVRADATVALRWGPSRQRFALHAVGAVRLGAVLAARNAGEPVLVATRWVSPRVGEQLRGLGVCWVDVAGNAYVRFGTVHIEVTGRRRPKDAVLVSTSSTTEGTSAVEPVESRPVRMTPLLTPANAKVIATLLSDPGLGSATLRELAAAAQVSLGQVHKAVTLLADAGYHRDRLDDAQRETLAQLLVQTGASFAQAGARSAEGDF